jgi:hypothetical protein
MLNYRIVLMMLKMTTDGQASQSLLFMGVDHFDGGVESHWQLYEYESAVLADLNRNVDAQCNNKQLAII